MSSNLPSHSHKTSKVAWAKLTLLDLEIIQVVLNNSNMTRLLIFFFVKIHLVILKVKNIILCILKIQILYSQKTLLCFHFQFAFFCDQLNI